MHRFIVRFALVVILGLFYMSTFSLGQSTLGSVSGTVTDPTGAAISGAHVTLTNLETGVTQSTSTNGGGMFNFRNLPVGSYSVKAAAQGFTAQEKTGLQLFADQAVTADIQMAVSGVQSRVVVNGQEIAIDTHNSELSDVITGSALTHMPVLSRQGGATGIVSDLFYMPGSQNPNSNSIANGTGDSSGYPPIDGARQLDTMITMDGMIVMSNVGDEGAGPVQPSEEGIQEIHTVLADAPAEFWRSAAVTVVSKSGTNKLHGTLFEDYNGSALNARSYFASAVPFRVENNFAASLGGPIRKDKLFYFGDYEGGRNVGRAVVVDNVPTTAERTGDFSALPYAIVNPYTGQPFPNNKIPSSMISSVSDSLQNALYPLPNYGSPNLQSGNYRNLIPTVTGWDVFDDADGSILYDYGDRDTWFGRASYRNLPRNAFRPNNLPAVGRITESRIGDSAVFTENHMFSPQVANELRFGYTDMQLSYNMVYDESGLIRQAGLQGPFTTASIPETPALTITSMTASTGVPDTIDNQRDYEWNDNLSWTRGRHLLKFGIDQIVDQTNEKSISNKIYGAYTFNGKFTGNGYADFLLGIPQQTVITSPGPTTSLHGIMLGVYAQDQFQVNPRLTINYGLRWEYQGPYSGAAALMYGFDPKDGAEVVETEAALMQLSPYFPSSVIPVETAAQAGYPSGSLLFSHYLNFYPRFGFAYRLFRNSGTVLRGAYGVYGNNVYAAAGTGQLFNGGPFTGSATFRNSFVNGQPRFSFPKPFLSTGTLGTQTAYANDPHMTTPYTQQWTLAVEQQVGTSAIAAVSYVGAASRSLLETINLDQPLPSTSPFNAAEVAYPKYNAVYWTQNGGVDNYNALEVSLRKNKGQNLSIDTGFTFARDLTDEQDIGSFNGQPPENRFCIGCDYGNNGLTRRYDYFLNTSYILPIGKGQRFGRAMNHWLDTLVGGWDISATGSVMSGQFFTPMVNSGYDTANTNTSFSQRPDRVGDPHVASQTIRNWFNVGAFAIPGCPASDPLCKHSTPVDAGRFGNVKPGSLIGPKYVDFDASVGKQLHLKDNYVFELRITAQNALNHPNFEIPDWNITDGPGVAGVITSLSAADLGPREVDLVGRFRF